MDFLSALLLPILIVFLLYVLRIPLILAEAKLSRLPAFSKQELGYRVLSELLTKSELSFYRVLVSVVKDAGVVFAKVRVADLLTPEVSRDRSRWQRAFNRISAKHFDFVICDAASLKPLLAIELDDASHQGRAAKQRDQIKDSAAESAGFALIRVRVQRSYRPEQLRVQLAKYLPSLVEVKINGEPDLSSPAVAAIPNPDVTVVIANKTAPQNDEVASPPCPMCGDGMTLRISRKGRHAGKSFWGCTRFPACRGVLLAKR